MVFGGQRQHDVQHLVFAGRRVDQGLAFVNREGGFQRRGIRAIEAERNVGDLHQRSREIGQKFRLIGPRNARVDVEHLGTGGDLDAGVVERHAHVAHGQGLEQFLASRRVDPFANGHKGLVRADPDLAIPKAEKRFHSPPERARMGWNSRCARALTRLATNGCGPVGRPPRRTAEKYHRIIPHLVRKPQFG